MRLIDAEKAVEELSVAYWDKGIQAAKDDPCIVDAMTDWAIRQIKAMPTMGGWVACSERLPEEEGEYLIWCVSYDVTTGNKVINAYGISYYDTQFEAWTGVNVGGFLWNEVVAWMPLPEPYKG